MYICILTQQLGDTLCCYISANVFQYEKPKQPYFSIPFLSDFFALNKKPSERNQENKREKGLLGNDDDGLRKASERKLLRALKWGKEGSIIEKIKFQFLFFSHES